MSKHILTHTIALEAQPPPPHYEFTEVAGLREKERKSSCRCPSKLHFDEALWDSC